jgi:glycolate oxidase FAD binding subunit
VTAAPLPDLAEATPGDAIDGVMPSWVAEPDSIEEAAGVLAYAHQRGLAVTPRGSGSKRGLGNRPKQLDIVLSTAHLNRVLEHAAGDLVLRLEAGARLDAVQRALVPAGQWLALDPFEGGTVGGIVATASCGSRRLRYGTPRDLLIGITYILPDGTIAHAGGKVVKNVAGYDLMKLVTGSLGTLVLLAETIFRLHPLPEVSATVTARGPGSNLDHLGAAVSEIMRSPLTPSALDVLAAADGSTLLVRFEGTDRGVMAQVESTRELLAGAGFDEIEVLRDSAESDLWRGTVPAYAVPPPGRTSLKIAVPIAVTSRVLMELVADVDRYEHALAHAGNGVILTSMAGSADEQITRLSDLRARVGAMGGTVIVRDAPPDIKERIDVWGPIGSPLPLMGRVKAAFDPTGIMNPGRFVGGMG